jgi:hypothetical protein
VCVCACVCVCVCLCVGVGAPSTSKPRGTVAQLLTSAATTLANGPQLPPARLASSDSLDEHAPFSVGIPSWLRESTDPSPGRNLFFMYLTPTRAGAGASRRASSSQRSSLDVPTPAGSCAAEGWVPQQQQQQEQLTRESGLAYGPRLMPHKSPFPDLVIGPLLGKGGYGRVFRGLHEGQQVAVKVRLVGGRSDGAGKGGVGRARSMLAHAQHPSTGSARGCPAHRRIDCLGTVCAVEPLAMPPQL